MASYDDGYCNATVGILVDVSRAPRDSDHRMVIIETDEPFVRHVVRRFINNWQDAELLIDRRVCVYESKLIAFPN